MVYKTNTMATKIILNRESEWMNKARGIKFFLDDVELGKVADGSSAEYLVEPGIHTMQCKIDWCSSGELKLQLNEGETKFLKIRSGMKYYSFGSILVILILLTGIFLDLAHITRPEYFIWLQVALILPSVFYLLYYLTIGRKKYLLLQEDNDNIFK